MAQYDFDTALVKRAQSDDERAREQLFGQLEPLLRAYFIKRLGEQSVVDDLVQNTMLRVHDGLDDLNRTDRLKAFAMKAALFEVQDYYRGRYDAKENLYDPELPPEQPGGGAPVEASVDVERALDTLKPQARRVMELRELGYKYREIAEEMDTTEAAIKMRVKRAFDKMRDALLAVVLLLSQALGG
jgi:RNA polymerase sigma-70 factor (ECF subfamily)